MINDTYLFFELIKLSLGTIRRLSREPKVSDWVELYDECTRQAILGVVLKGLAKLPDEQKPPKQLLLQWMGMVMAIEDMNRVVSKRCAEITSIFANDGYRTCILKGQGNAMMYPDPLSRTPGDIDIWVEGGKGKVVEYVHHIFPNINVEYHHMAFPVFDDVEVEVHYFPSFCYNKIHNKYLLQYFKDSGNEQFEHFVQWESLQNSFCVPTISFNLVFQISHMMRHFFTQGIGLRHAIDYYFLLCQDISDKEKKEAVSVMKKCGMYKFLCAIMWIQIEVLGLKKNTDLAVANDKAGKMVLDEMMKGGNFGKSYSHNKGGDLERYARQMIYRLRFIKEFPSEPLWRPFSLVWDYVKKRV